jgi:hypothetical protein
MVEQRTFNPWVLGSSPRRPTGLYGFELGVCDPGHYHGPFWLQFWLQLRSAPQCLTDLIGGVPGEFRCDVGAALGLAELGVAENLLDDADVDALFQ